ncbi:MAG: AAA family ATPase [Endomicrobiia bacterium]
MNKNNNLVIGLTAPNAAGKGEVCKYLSGKGFLVMSLSDILRKEAFRRGLKPTRDNLIMLGNDLRTKFGSEILAKRLSKEILKLKHDKIVVDSIRTVGEIKQLKKVFKKKFVLINISAPRQLRFKFMQHRARDGDPKSFKEFLKIERQECSNNSIKQQIHKCRILSNYFINNNSTLQKLYQKVDKIIKKIETELDYRIS